jgi:WD40 repeat protein
VLSASRDHTAWLWGADNGKLLTTFQGHTSPVYSAIFSPDSRRVLTASVDHTARLWETDSGKLSATFQGHTSPVYGAIFNPNGRCVLTASGGFVRLFETFFRGGPVMYPIAVVLIVAVAVVLERIVW